MPNLFGSKINWRYQAGFSLTFTIGLGVLILALQKPEKNASSHRLEESRVVFLPETLDAIEPPVLSGQQRFVEMRLRNASENPVLIQDIRLSCPCASLFSSNESTFPTVMSPGKEVLLRIGVMSSDEFAGKLRLQIDAIGGQGASRLASGAILLELVGSVNPEIGLIAMGTLKKKEGLKTVKVRLWHPTVGRLPGECTAEATAPSMKATITKLDQQDAGRIYFAEVVIEVDPSRVRSHFDEKVFVKTDAGKTQIRVLGFVED